MRGEKLFRDKYPFDQRKKVADSLLSRHPDRIPVIVSPLNSKAPAIDRHKFLVPRDCPVYQFTAEIRSHIKVRGEEALFFYFKNTIAAHSMTMGMMYDKHKESDGFLYVIYSVENTFG